MDSLWLVLIAFHSSAFASVETGFLQAPEELVQLSTYILVVASEERKGFRVKEVLFDRDGKAPKVGRLVRPSPAGARDHRQVDLTGQEYGRKGPLLLTYRKGIEDSKAGKRKEAIVCLFRRPESSSKSVLELAVNQAWLPTSQRGEILEAAKTAPGGNVYDLRERSAINRFRADAGRILAKVKPNWAAEIAAHERLQGQLISFSEAHKRVIDTLSKQEKRTHVLYGSIEDLARKGQCWEIEPKGRMGGVTGYVDVETGKLVLMWKVPEG